MNGHPLYSNYLYKVEDVGFDSIQTVPSSVDTDSNPIRHIKYRHDNAISSKNNIVFRTNSC